MNIGPPLFQTVEYCLQSMVQEAYNFSQMTN